MSETHEMGRPPAGQAPREQEQMGRPPAGEAQREQEQRDLDRQQRIEMARQRAQVSPEQRQQEADRMAFASIGAQVILDYHEDGSRGARGGAGRTIEENQMARDRHLAAMGFDPAAPSGPPPTPEQREARRAAEEAMAKAQIVPPGAARATKTSSLATGASEGVELKEPEAENDAEPPAPEAA
jgi:hypothetical protein